MKRLAGGVLVSALTLGFYIFSEVTKLAFEQLTTDHESIAHGHFR